MNALRKFQRFPQRVAHFSAVTPSKAQVISSTKYWVDNFVIKHELCPWAKAVVVGKGAHYEVLDINYETASEGELFDDCMDILGHCEDLAGKPFGHTTLLILPQVTQNFEMFLEFVGLVEEVLADTGLVNFIQIASFHPNYVFQESETPDDAENYTNRSPFPILHLLRVDDVSTVTKPFPNGDTSAIWQRNIATMNKIGKDQLKCIHQALLTEAQASPTKQR